MSERQTQAADANSKTSQQRDAYRPVLKKFDDRGGERYYGSTAAVSLVESSRRVLGEILGDSETKSDSSVCELVARDPTLKNELQSLSDNFPVLESCREPEFRSDGKAVSHPPRSFINSILDTYLETIHVTRPIFQESSLRTSIDQHNAGNDVEPIEATKLCFNNIIILTLGLKLRQRRCTEPDSHGMDDDLLLSFLKNSGRAFGYLSLFLEPRLRNVQALATLAMVAREYWESHVFERVCHLACHVAKSMGLLRRPANEAGSTPERNETRTQLFWVLYVMDKERTFMTGVPCDLYFFDSDIQLHEEETGVSIQNYAVAHYHIMSLWEDIYVALYSSRAARTEASQRAQQVSRLNDIFRSWGFKYKALLRTDTDPGESAKDCFQLELKYCFHLGQILIHQCGREETNTEQRLNSMYFALNLIQEVYRKRFSLPHFALLGRSVFFLPIGGPAHTRQAFPLLSQHRLPRSLYEDPTTSNEQSGHRHPPPNTDSRHPICPQRSQYPGRILQSFAHGHDLVHPSSDPSRNLAFHIYQILTPGTLTTCLLNP